MPSKKRREQEKKKAEMTEFEVVVDDVGNVLETLPDRLRKVFEDTSPAELNYPYPNGVIKVDEEYGDLYLDKDTQDKAKAAKAKYKKIRIEKEKIKHKDKWGKRTEPKKIAYEEGVSTRTIQRDFKEDK